MREHGIAGNSRRTDRRSLTKASASWLDLATREVIGYSMADHHRAELVVDALDMAAAPGRLEPGCVIHSDRGSPYTSGQLRTRISELGHRQSMGRTGSCFDNAAAESFWLKETSRPTRHVCAIGKIRPSRYNDTASKITGKLQRAQDHRRRRRPLSTTGPQERSRGLFG